MQIFMILSSKKTNPKRTQFRGPITGDFEPDCDVDMDDLGVINKQWNKIIDSDILINVGSSDVDGKKLLFKSPGLRRIWNGK